MVSISSCNLKSQADVWRNACGQLCLAPKLHHPARSACRLQLKPSFSAFSNRPAAPQTLHKLSRQAVSRLQHPCIAQCTTSSKDLTLCCGSCSLSRDFSAFNNRPPGSSGSLQAQLNGSLIPTTNSFAFTTARLPPATVTAFLRTTALFLEDLNSTAFDYQEGQLLSIA